MSARSGIIRARRATRRQRIKSRSGRRKVALTDQISEVVLFSEINNVSLGIPLDSSDYTDILSRLDDLEASPSPIDTLAE